MTLEFREYHPRKIVNRHKHVDSWFWTKYSAHPYIGCRSGCEFCYLRGGQYLGRRDPDTFDTLIQVKMNAAELLRRELPRLEKDVLACGDWQQPAEDRYRLSRQMLEAVCEAGFPLFIVERSPLLTRDLDLLADIHQRSHVSVVISFSNLDPALKRAFEPRSPGLKRRLEMMSTLAQAGLLVGMSLMPVIPFVGDDVSHLEEAVRMTKDHGGAFVLVGGMTMEGVQAERTLAAAARLDPALEGHWRELFRWPEGGRPANYGPPRAYQARLGNLVRELCAKHGLRDRMPRYIAPGPLAANKRLAEQLFLRTYDLELEQADESRLWAYRKAAWLVDEMTDDIAALYHQHGQPGLRRLPGIGQGLAGEMARWLQA
jgi:DNA repair photolyase